MNILHRLNPPVVISAIAYLAALPGAVLLFRATELGGISWFAWALVWTLASLVAIKSSRVRTVSTGRFILCAIAAFLPLWIESAGFLFNRYDVASQLFNLLAVR